MEQKEISIGVTTDDENASLLNNEEESSLDDDQPPCWNILSYVIPPLYCLLVIGILGTYITGFILTELQSTFLYSLLGGTMAMSNFSAWLVFIAPTFQDQISRLEEANDTYKQQLNR